MYSLSLPLMGLTVQIPAYLPVESCNFLWSQEPNFPWFYFINLPPITETRISIAHPIVHCPIAWQVK